MKTRKILIAIAAAGALGLLSTVAYCGWGGPEPSKSLGNYRSFSFYADRPGNAAAIWMQPGNSPANPWNEFWFDQSGNFNLGGGIIAPGTSNLGSLNIGNTNITTQGVQAPNTPVTPKMYDSLCGTSGHDCTSGLADAFGTLNSYGQASNFDVLLPQGSNSAQAYYDFGAQLSLPDGIYLHGPSGTMNVRMRYTGSANSSAALIWETAAASGSNAGCTGAGVPYPWCSGTGTANAHPWAYNDMENIEFDANNLAGYAFALSGALPVTGNAQYNKWQGCSFTSGTVAAMMLGNNNPDVSVSSNYLTNDQWQLSPIGIILNSQNNYNTYIDGGTFYYNTAYDVVQLSAGNTNITDTEFSLKPVTSSSATYTNSTPYAVYMVDGTLNIHGIYMEDLRLAYLDPSVSGRTYQQVTIEGVHTNASWMTTTNFPNGVWSIYNKSASLFLRDASFNSYNGSNAPAAANIYSAGKIDIANCDLGPYGMLFIPPGSIGAQQSIVEGRAVGHYNNLLPNWNFAYWLSSSSPAYWSGSGYGTYTLSQDATYASVMQTGSANNLQINVTAAAASYLAGLATNFPVGNQQWVTAVAFGRASSTSLTPRFYDAHGNGGTTCEFFTIGSDSNYFVATYEINLTGLAAGSLDTLFFGLNVGQTGQLWVGSIVLIPGRFPEGEASGLWLAAPTTVFPPLSGAGAPTFNAWQAGLTYINTAPSPHTVYTSVQTGTGASDWVQP